LVFPALCPHQMGPLVDAQIIAGAVTCPWHGYRFDLHSGDNLTGQACRFTQLPRVELRGDELVLRHC